MNDPRAQCKHENFAAGVHVVRLTSEEGVVGGFLAEVQVRCLDCGVPFEFSGVDVVGLSSTQPAVNPDNTQLRAPIRPPFVLPVLG